MNRLLLTMLILAVPLAVNAADDLKVSQLEQQVLTLQRDVNRVTQELEQLRSQWMRAGSQQPLVLPVAPRPVQSDSWLDASKWQQVKAGMSELQVVALLGPPASMRGTDQERVLLYAMEIGLSGFLGGSVTLRDRTVVSVKVPVLQ